MMCPLPRATALFFTLLAFFGISLELGAQSNNLQKTADDTVEAVRKNPKHAEEIVRQAILDWEARGPDADPQKSLAAIVGGAVAALPRDEAVEALQAAMAMRPAYAAVIAQTALAIFPEGVRSRPTDLIPFPGMQPGVAKVVKIQGGSAMTVDAAGRRESLREGEFLRDGCSISTGPSTSVVLLFDNGTTIQVEPESDFSIDRLMSDPFEAEAVDYGALKEEPSRSSTLVGVADGAVFFDVAKLKKTSSFEISTPLGVAGIRGTAGFFQNGSNGSPATGSFGLSSGSADFTTPNGLSNSVGAGESLGVGGQAQGYAMESNSGAMQSMIQKSAEVALQNRAAIGGGAFRGAPTRDSRTQETVLSPEQIAALQQAAAEGVEALTQTALMLTLQTPALASEIAAAAAALLPAAAVQVAVVIANAFPSLAPSVAAAVAAVVPAAATTLIAEVTRENLGFAVSIAVAVAAVVPEQASQIVTMMARNFPEQASSVAAAVAALIPAQGDAISWALQIAAQPGGQPGSQAPVNPPMPDMSSQNPGVLNRESAGRPTPPPLPTPSPRTPTPTPTPTPVSPSA